MIASHCFTKKKSKYFKNNKVNLHGIMNESDRLWDLPIISSKSGPNITPKQQNLNVIIQRNKTKYQLANFYHVALCSPALSTLIKAINNNHFLSWPWIKKIKFQGKCHRYIDCGSWSFRSRTSKCPIHNNSATVLSNKFPDVQYQ